MKPIKCKITPLVLGIIEPCVIKNVLSLEWEKKNEQNAMATFIKVEGQKHEKPKLIACGLYICKSHPYIGATPNNVFQCKCCNNKYCVEYKCPYSIREEEILVAWFFRKSW